MITGVVSSNQRVNPWAVRYYRQPGNTSTNTSTSSAYVEGSTIYFRDHTDADIMSSSSVSGTFTDQVTTGIDSSGMIKFTNNRWFFRNAATLNLITASTLTGTQTTISKDARDVLWFPAASLWVIVGDDGAGNALCSTSSNGTTWTDRADIFSADRATCLATDGTRLYVTGNNNNMYHTTSTTAPFTWTKVTTTGFAATDDPKFINYIPEKTTWVATCDNNDLCAYSTNGTSWNTVDLNMGTGNGAINVMWLPSINRWVATSSGNTTASGKGQYICVSSTDSISSTWNQVVADNVTTTDWFTVFAQSPFNNFNFQNKYLVSGGPNNQFFYTRAG
jgi:hypothetical protein